MTTSTLTRTEHNPSRTQITRGERTSVPARRIATTYRDVLRGRRVMHHGEGQALVDTNLFRVAAGEQGSVTAYDPYSPDPRTRDEGRMRQQYGVCADCGATVGARSGRLMYLGADTGRRRYAVALSGACCLVQRVR